MRLFLIGAPEAQRNQAAAENRRLAGTHSGPEDVEFLIADGAVTNGTLAREEEQTSDHLELLPNQLRELNKRVLPGVELVGGDGLGLDLCVLGGLLHQLVLTLDRTVVGGEFALLEGETENEPKERERRESTLNELAHISERLRVELPPPHAEIDVDEGEAEPERVSPIPSQRRQSRTDSSLRAMGADVTCRAPPKNSKNLRMDAHSTRASGRSRSLSALTEKTSISQLPLISVGAGLHSSVRGCRPPALPKHSRDPRLATGGLRVLPLGARPRDRPPARFKLIDPRTRRPRKRPSSAG